MQRNVFMSVMAEAMSSRLEAARAAGMKPLQAVWYLREGVDQPCGKMDEFDQAGTPLDVLSYIC